MVRKLGVSKLKDPALGWVNLLWAHYEYVLPIAAACSKSACVQLVLAGRVMVAVPPPPGLVTL